MLVDAALSGLPAFLTPRPGLNSGFMIPQVTAAALVSENKQCAYPASVDSIPTSANQEDHVSMSAHAARRLTPMALNTAAILGVETLAAAQGCDFHSPLLSSEDLERVRHDSPLCAAAGRRPLHEPRLESGDRIGARWQFDRRIGNHPAIYDRSELVSGDWLTIRRGRAPCFSQSPTRASTFPRISRPGSSLAGSAARTRTGGSTGSMSL